MAKNSFSLHHAILLLSIVVSITLFLFTQSIHAQTCAVSLSGGTSIDVSKLDTTSGYQVDDSKDPAYKFYFNVCGFLVAKPSETICASASGQAFQYSYSLRSCYPISKPATPTVTLLNPSDEKGGVKVVHQPTSYEGASRQLSLEISCDANGPATPTFRYVKEQPNGGIIVYTFSGSSKSVCPGAAPPGPGPNPDNGGDDLPLGQYGIGGLVLTLALVGFILYFIIGFAILKFKMQKTGTEVIPQFAFWKDLPFLFIDGVMLPVDLIKGAMGKKNYQEVA